ncbi:MAG: HAMP domain-containing histidine kinase [Actinomycetia bacterium]|nr:HAMP domain-containing histidine kinase [Actinomycetes bacterium]
MEAEKVVPVGFAARTRTRIVAVVGGLGIVVILIALAFVFATSSGARQVAESARSLHEANAAAGSAALSRAALAQATVFGIDNELGVASDEALDIALTAATVTLTDVEHWADVLASNSSTSLIAGDLNDFANTGSQIVALLADGQAIEAEQLRGSDLEQGYDTLAAALASRQAATVDEIRRTERFAGAVGWLTRLLATLLIPAVAIILYFLLVRRQLREARLTMNAQLEAEQELGRAKDDFIAGISHELRTPLTSIYGFSEYLVNNDVLDPDETVELVALIHEDSVELSRMIEDLLTAARVESDALKFAYENVDLRAETVAATGAMTRSGATVQIMGDVLCWADPNRVRQIIRNLVSNAIKHGGPTVDVYLESDGDRAVLTVSDNGEVMDPDLEQRMFDRFVHDGVETLLTGSVGLGLSIARSLARTMGGDIRFVRAGGWTNFEVSLPRNEGVPIEVPPAAQAPIVTDGPFAERVLAAYS